MRSPGSAFVCSRTLATSCSDRWRARGPSSDGPFSTTRNQASPLAPALLACSVSSSSREREKVAPSGTTIALTVGDENALTSVCCEHLGEIDQLHAEAEVGLVGAEAVPGLGPRDALDRRGPLPRGGLGGIEDGLGDEGHHVVLAGEGALHVELHELELAVGPQVLVAQAAGDLEVAVEAAHHEELLGQLRALGQGVEGAVVQAGRDRELPGALGRGRPQQRRLDLHEALAVHGGPQRRVDPGARAAGCAAYAAGAGRRSGSAAAPARRTRRGRRRRTAGAPPR